MYNFLKQIINILKWLVKIGLNIVGLLILFLAVYNFRLNSFNHKKIIENEQYVTYDNFFYIDKSLDSEKYSKIFLASYYQLPPNIQQLIRERWIFVGKPDISGEQEYLEDYIGGIDAEMEVSNDTVGGATDSINKIINIYIKPDADDEIFVTTIYHEIGHAISTELGFADMETSWVNLYSSIEYLSPCTRNIPEYVMANTAEFFATTFADYILYGEEISELYPNIYHYWDNVIPQIEGRPTYWMRLKYSLFSVANALDELERNPDFLKGKFKIAGLG